MVCELIACQSFLAGAQQAKDFVRSRVAQTLAEDESSWILAIMPGCETSPEVLQPYFGGFVKQAVQHREANCLRLRSRDDCA
jgi:hypothetical protein